MTEPNRSPDPTRDCSMSCSRDDDAGAAVVRRPGPPAKLARSIWPLVCGSLFLLIPKCPLCLAAWMALAGVAGGANLHGWLRVAIVAAFAVALGAFAINAWRWRDVRPLALVVIGGALAWTSQAMESGGAVRSVALILLAVAAVWNTHLRARSGHRRSVSRSVTTV